MENKPNIPQPQIGKHPGIHLREILEARGWLQRDLAFILGCPEKGINLIFSGKRGISPEMSKALGHALSLPPDYFADIQKAYDLACANEPNPAISLRARMQDNYPIREMIKRGWLKDTDAEGLERQLASFFNVKSPNDIPYLAHSAKKTNYEEKEIPPAQLAWLFRVKQVARSISVPKYSAYRLSESLEGMRHLLIAPEEARRVPRILSDCGVRLIMVESLPKSKIDGVSFWMDDHSPVIGLSFRYDRIDNFWFVLRHEIEHILNGEGRDIAMIDAELEGARAGSSLDISESERKANAAAAAFCVPKDKMESFMRRKHPFYYERDVLAFSQINGIHPALVVGQIQNRTDRHDFLRKYQVKIRQFVVPGSIADGWGQTIPIDAEEGLTYGQN
ncbi:MAG: ImmA/IrrE family metallo-endopeptidase [Nitrospiraceae bacterium]|nr:ImmA/IrrE family metallo-endopeptidase [Nitrospiraceae bacterium]